MGASTVKYGTCVNKSLFQALGWEFTNCLSDVTPPFLPTAVPSIIKIPSLLCKCKQSWIAKNWTQYSAVIDSQKLDAIVYSAVIDSQKIACNIRRTITTALLYVPKWPQKQSQSIQFLGGSMSPDPCLCMHTHTLDTLASHSQTRT